MIRLGGREWLLCDLPVGLPPNLACRLYLYCNLVLVKLYFLQLYYESLRLHTGTTVRVWSTVQLVQVLSAQFERSLYSCIAEPDRLRSGASR